MVRRALVILVIFVASACAPRVLRVVSDVPPEVDWLGLLFLTADGEMVGGTGLMPVVAGASIEHLHQLEFDLAEQVVMVGVRGDDLAPLVGASGREQLLLDERLRIANSRDPLLPVAWAAFGQTDLDLMQLVPGPPPEVTAAWLPACPRVLSEQPDPEVRFGTNTGLFCPASATQQGCRLVTDLRGCLSRPPPDLLLDGRGSLDGIALGSDCRVVEPRVGARFSIRCFNADEEQADLYVPPMPAPFVVDRAALVPVADPSSRLDVITRPLLGHLRALAIAANCPGAPVVVLQATNPLEYCPTDASLIFVDPTDLEVTSTVPLALPCASLLTPDPSGPGLFVVSGRPLSVTHLDCDGRPDETYQPADARADLLDVSASAWTPRAAGGPATDLIVTTSRDENPGLLWVFDSVERRFAEALAVEGGAYILSVGVLGPNYIVLGVRDPISGDVRLVFMDYLSATPRFVGLAEGPTITEKAPYFLTTHQGYTVVSSPSGRSYGIPALRTAVLEPSGPTYLDRSGDWMMYGSVSTGIPWPNSPYLLLPTTADPTVGGSLPPPRTIVGLFDPRDQHFLPGRAELGYGPVSAAAVDGTGSVWMTLTWSGELVRIRARPVP